MGAVASPAAADVLINVDKATQRMTVTVDGSERYTWAVSTGLAGGPPSGTFRPERMERMWYSRAFGMAPMPHSIFFRGPFAIHGTTMISRLGQPASHGCVRLHPDNATILFDLVAQEGPRGEDAHRGPLTGRSPRSGLRSSAGEPQALTEYLEAERVSEVARLFARRHHAGRAHRLARRPDRDTRCARR